MKKLIAVLAAMVVAGAVSQVLGQGSVGGTIWRRRYYIPIGRIRHRQTGPTSLRHLHQLTWTNTLPTSGVDEPARVA